MSSTDIWYPTCLPANWTDQDEIECLKKLKKLILDDEELRNIKGATTEDELLMMLVRGRECNAESAFRTLQSLKKFMVKTYPHLFDKTNPNCVKHILDNNLYEVIKRPVDSGPAVILFRTKNWNTRDASIDDLIAAGVLYVYQLSKASVEVQRQGIVAIIDTNGFGFSHARQATYETAMKVLNCLTYGSPVRFLAFIVINAHPLFEKLFHVMKYVIPEKARKNIFINKKELSSLHSFVSPEVLPVSLGGIMLEEDAWLNNFGDIVYKDDFIFKMVCDIRKDINTSPNWN